MNERERLEELINQAIDTYATMPLVNGCRPELKYFLADYLLANGVVVVDMNVVSPKNRPLISQCLGRPIDEIIELVNAKDEGRILALPCMGDTVYWYNMGGELTEAEVKMIGVSVRHSQGYEYNVRFEDFGKTVFRSRKLAEEALNEQKKL